MTALNLRRIFALSLPLLPLSAAACGDEVSSITSTTSTSSDAGLVDSGNDAGVWPPNDPCMSIPGYPRYDRTIDTTEFFPSDGGDARTFDAGATLSDNDCNLVCQGSSYQCTASAIVGTQLTVTCQVFCLGREPAGLHERTRRVGDLGAYFAEMARIEAASVHAFRTMVDELTFHGAPKSLIAEARRAARDEVVHARAAARMARRFGGNLEPVAVSALRERSLFAMALENEVEGCVRETFGALVGMHQAQFAEDGDVRAMMSTVSDDEARHAELSHRVAEWACTKLSAAESAALDAARDNALRALQDGIQRESLAPWQRTLGLPNERSARVLLAALKQTSARAPRSARRVRPTRRSRRGESALAQRPAR